MTEIENKQDDATSLNLPPVTLEEQISQLEGSIAQDRQDLAEMAGSLTAEEIGVFTHDIDEQEVVLSLFYQSLQELRGEPPDGEDPSVSESDKLIPKEVDMGKIGWMPQEGMLSVGCKSIGKGENRFLFGSIVEEDRVANRAAEKLKDSGEWGDLIQKIETEAIPQLWLRILRGDRNLRPVSIGGRSLKEVTPDNSMNTTYPAYKIGVHGTNNRALVIVMDRHDDGSPVFILTALYDHDDQKRVLQHMFLKQKRGT